MKLRFFISILFVLLNSTVVIANNDPNVLLPKSPSIPFALSNTSLDNTYSNNPIPSSDSLAFITALINSLNNSISLENNNISKIGIIIAVLGVIIGLIGLFIAIAGFINFRDLKNDFKEYQGSIDKRVDKNEEDISNNNNTINEKIDNIEDKIEEKIEKYQNNINLRVNKNEEYLFQNITEFQKNIEKYKEMFDNIKEDISNNNETINEKIDNIEEKIEEKIEKYQNNINLIVNKNEEYISQNITEFQNNIEKYKETFDNIKEDIQTQIKHKTDEIKEIQDRVNEKSIEFENKQEYQNQYLQRINRYLFSVTNSIVDSKDPNEPQTSIIRNNLYNQYHLIKLNLPWTEGEDGTEADFMYLKAHGTKDIIDELQYIADNDRDERKRKLALATIGFIQANEINNPSA